MFGEHALNPFIFPAHSTGCIRLCKLLLHQLCGGNLLSVVCRRLTLDVLKKYSRALWKRGVLFLENINMPQEILAVKITVNRVGRGQRVRDGCHCQTHSPVLTHQTVHRRNLAHTKLRLYHHA